MPQPAPVALPAPVITMPSATPAPAPAPSPAAPPRQTAPAAAAPAAKGTPAPATGTVKFRTGPGETGHPAGYDTLNGVAFAPLPKKPDFKKIKDVDLDEPAPLPGRAIDRVTVCVREPDGRIWFAKETNNFSGRSHLMPGGTVEKGLTLQQNAIKEVFEETGLMVKITGYAGDIADANYEVPSDKSGRTSHRWGRVYFAERIGGAPWAAEQGHDRGGNLIRHEHGKRKGQLAAENSHVLLASPKDAMALMPNADDKAHALYAMLKHEGIPADTKFTGPGSSAAKYMFNGLEAKAAQYHQRNPNQGGAANGNGFLHAIQEMRGYNDKPERVGLAAFNAKEKAGEFKTMANGNTRMARSVGGPQASQYAKQLRDGNHYPGFGMFGNGTYFDSKSSGSNVAAGPGAHYGTAVNVGALKKDAKLIKFAEIVKLHEAAFPRSDGGAYHTVPTTYKKAGRGGKSYTNTHGRNEQWRGLHAAMLGYDAIYQDGSLNHYGRGYLAVLNRSKMVMVDRSFTTTNAPLN